MTAHRTARLSTAVLALTLAACAPTSNDGTTPPSPSTPAAASASPSLTKAPSMRISLTIGDTVLPATLADNPTAHDLADQLPLTLRLGDFNRVEKVGELPRPLTMDGVPAGDDPEINDIGYYAPSRSLVFYYGDVGYFNGIVRIGRLDPADTDLIRRQPDGFEVTIAGA